MVSIVLVANLANLQTVTCDTIETIETIEYKDSNGLQRTEYAFRAPMKGVPKRVLELYCANVKVRLYWGVFREEVINPVRKGLYLRRVARLTRHLFSEVADVDKPFEGERLSTVDEYFAVNDKPKDDESEEEKRSTFAGIEAKIKGLFRKRREPDSVRAAGSGFDHADSDEELDEHSEEALRYLVEAEESIGAEGKPTGKKNAQGIMRDLAPKVALGLYTRYRTMWWMMMSCLFTKYYLWDPALDEFIKLKRTMNLYPDFQLMRLQDLQCKSTKFFAHILDVCKILNPLLKMDFGTMNLDKLTKFKGDQKNT